MEARDVEKELSSGTVAIGASPKKRVLFVDDEAGILEGLRAVLRPQRKEWDMVFALGGQAGLDEVKKSAFDVVVTDMRMPVLSGAELLRHVKELQPGAVRLVLSGQSDADVAMRSVFTAHQFLAKPCDAEDLRTVIHRACHLHQLVTAPELRALAGDVCVLPAAPRTYMGISQALGNPKCGVDEVARIVELDPALCAKVLQVANSAFFGLPRVVTSIKQATSYLGTLALRNLALAMETLAAAAGRSNLTGQRLEAYQTNSLMVGLICRRWFASDRRKADDAFVAGMLRDMGHLVLAGRKPTAAPDEVDHHAALSAYLLGLWGIPYSIIEAVAFHEDPASVAHDELELVDVVHLADRIAAEVVPCPFQVAPPPLSNEFLARVGLSSRELEVLRQGALELRAEARSMLI